MEPIINHGFVAANIYFVGTCNLQCKYCFQPKAASRMKDVNEKIVDWIESKKMLDDIEKYIGKNVECFSLWGGEPSINLPHLTNILEESYDRFPKLNSISYSTNISKRHLAQNTVDLIKKAIELNKTKNRRVRVDVQCSIDGPPEVNDKDRIGSSADEIMNNITYVLEQLKDIPKEDRNFNFHMKGTQSADTFKWMLEPNEKYGTNLNYHYHYFDDWVGKWKEICDFYPRNGASITLVYPGHYTQEDGKRFAEITKILLSPEFRNQEWKGNPDFNTQVSSRVQATTDTLRRGVRKEHKGELLCNCTCSAGRSCAGISYDGKYHWCQSTYFFDPETLDYLKENNMVSDFEKSQGYSFSNFANYVKDVEVVDYNDDLRLSRTLNLTNIFWTNLSMRLQYIRMQIDQLALSGQISPCFKEEKWASMLTAYFIYGGNECPADNMWEFGSIYIKDNSHIKMVANGAFELLVNSFTSNGNYKEEYR